MKHTALYIQLYAVTSIYQALQQAGINVNLQINLTNISFAPCRNQPICVVVSNVSINSEGLTEVSFYSLSNDGHGVVPLQAVLNAVEVRYTHMTN